MKNRSTAKAVRKAYEPPQLIVYGKVSDLTHGGKGHGGKGHGGKGHGGKGRGGKGRGHGGSRS